MGRVYTVIFDNAAITTANGDYDLFEVSPADDKPVAIVGLLLFVLSEVGDAAEEWLRINIIRGHTTSGSGGSTNTGESLNPVDTAPGFATEQANTAIASVGTTDTLYALGMNVRTGLEQWFPPEARPVATQANTTIVVRLMAAVTDDLTMSGTLILEELA